jgi:hypothetical protein
MNYDLLLGHYYDHGGKFSRAERMWFAGQPTLAMAVRVATAS